MLRSLIVLDTEVDPLWRRHLPAPTNTAGDDSADHKRIIIDLKSPPSPFRRPHYNDPVNWRRWLCEHHIEQLHCYLPGRKAPLLLAAAPKDTEIILHLTAYITPEALRRLKLLRSCVKQFICVGRFIAAPLLKANFNPERITVEIPPVWAPRPGITRRQLLRRQIKKDKTGPLILALSRPQHAAALKPVVWAAALLGHALRDFTLLVAGPGDPIVQQRLQRWQKTMDAVGTIYHDPQTFAFDDLVSACDAVVAGPGPFHEVIRLLHARAQEQYIVTCNGDSAEYLENYPKVYYASSTTPCQIAGAVMKLLKRKRDREPCPAWG